MYISEGVIKTQQTVGKGEGEVMVHYANEVIRVDSFQDAGLAGMLAHTLSKQ